MTNGRPTPDELLSAYHDGELTAAERQGVERLLEDSADARAELEDYRALSEMLRALPAEPVPDGIRAAVMRRIERELLIPPAPAAAPPGRPRRKLWAFAGLLASAAAALIVAVTAFRDRPPVVGDRTLAAAKPPAGAARDLPTPMRFDRAGAAAPASGAAADAEAAKSEALAERMTEAAGQASVTNSAVASSFRLPKDAAVGDVFSYLEQTPDGDVVVVRATVVDERKALDQLQFLLAKNSIPLQPVAVGAGGFGGGTVDAVAAAGERNGEFAVYVESEPAQIGAALADIDRDKDQFVDLQLAGVLNPSAEYGVQLNRQQQLYAGAEPMGRAGRSEQARPLSARGMGVDGNAAAGARFRASVPVEELRAKAAPGPAPASAPAVPAQRPILPDVTQKAEWPLPAAAEPPVAENGQSARLADQPAPNFGYQTVLNVSKAALEKQMQPVEDTVKEADAKKADGGNTFNYYAREQLPAPAPGAPGNAPPDTSAAGGESESVGQALQQTQRRLRLLVVLESRGEAALGRAAKLKADAARPPVEAPQPLRKKG